MILTWTPLSCLRAGKRFFVRKRRLNYVYRSSDSREAPLAQAIPLGLQHVFAMFGATVLVPFLTGLSPSVALLSSGIGTIIFLLLTKSRVPAYLGSSFAYIAALTTFVQSGNTSGAMGGVLAVGVVYIILYLLMAAFGTQWIHTIVPPSLQDQSLPLSD